MRVALDKVGVTWDPSLQQQLDEGVRLVAADLQRLDVEAEELAVRVFSGEGDACEARLELTLPDEVVPASITALDASAALRGAFELLQRRVARYAGAVDATRWRPLGQGVSGDPGVQRYHDAVVRYALPVMRRVAVHDLELLVDEGEIPDGAVDPEDVVDAVFAARLPELSGGVPVVDVTWQLLDDLREHIEEAVRAFAEEEGDGVVSLGRQTSAEEIRWTRPQVEDSEQEVWGTADILDATDVLGDLESIDPETWADELHERDQLVQALFGLPDELRRVFTQVVLDKWSVSTVASAWSRPRDEIRADVQLAAWRLARKLGPTWGLAPARVIEVYAALGRVLHSERKADEVALAGSEVT